MNCIMCNLPTPGQELCRECSELCFQLPDDECSVEYVVGKFIYIHTSQWQYLKNQYIGCSINSSRSGKHYMRLCSSASLLPTFFSYLWEQFSIFISPVSIKVPAPIWKSDTKMSEWMEGGYLFADYVIENEKTLKFTLNDKQCESGDRDVLMTLAAKAMTNYWNDKLKTLREKTIEIEYCTSNAKLSDFIDDLEANNAITRDEIIRYKTILLQRDFGIVPTKLQAKPNHYQAKIDEIIAHLVETKKINPENASAVRKHVCKMVENGILILQNKVKSA